MYQLLAAFIYTSHIYTYIGSLIHGRIFVPLTPWPLYMYACADTFNIGHTLNMYM